MTIYQHSLSIPYVLISVFVKLFRSIHVYKAYLFDLIVQTYISRSIVTLRIYMVYVVALLYSNAIFFHSCFSRWISKRSVSLTLFYILINVVKLLIFITMFPFSERFARKSPIHVGFCVIMLNFCVFLLYFKKYIRQR